MNILSVSGITLQQLQVEKWTLTMILTKKSTKTSKVQWMYNQVNKLIIDTNSQVNLIQKTVKTELRRA